MTPGRRNKIAAARARVRRHVWAQLPGGIPASKVAGTDLADVIVLEIDATSVIAHSQKENAAATFKRPFGYHPIGVWCDNTSEFLAAKLQAGNADVASRSRSHGPGQPRSSRSSRTSPPSRNRPVRPRHHHPENRSPAAPAGPSSYPQSLRTRAHSTTRLRHDPDRRHERPGARCSRLPCQWGGDGCRTLRNSLQRVARVD